MLREMRLTSESKGNCISWGFAPMRTISKWKPTGDTSWDKFVRVSSPAPRIMNGRVVVVDDDLFSRQGGIVTHGDCSVIDGRSVYAIYFDGVPTLGQRWGLIPLEVGLRGGVHVGCVV